MSDAEQRTRLIQSFYGSFGTRDRLAVEASLDNDFHFTSPRDNRIDRRTFLEQCWPGQAITAIDVHRLMLGPTDAFVTYEISTTDPLRIRNTEHLAFRLNRIVEIEVYFGWTVPHEVPDGGFLPDVQS